MGFLEESLGSQYRKTLVLSKSRDFLKSQRNHENKKKDRKYADANPIGIIPKSRKTVKIRNNPKIFWLKSVIFC